MKKCCFYGCVNKKGFTLIEMLVVVLIIGILASIAIPSFITAVDKARYVKILHAVDTIAEAEEAYYLQYRKYTQNVQDLSVKLGYPLCGKSTVWHEKKIDGTYEVHTGYCFPGGGYVTTKWTEDYNYDVPEGESPYKLQRYVMGYDTKTRVIEDVMDENGNISKQTQGGVAFYRFLNHRVIRPGTRWCIANKKSSRYQRLCKSLGGKLYENTDIGYNGSGAQSYWYLLP